MWSLIIVVALLNFEILLTIIIIVWLVGRSLRMKMKEHLKMLVTIVLYCSLSFTPITPVKLFFKEGRYQLLIAKFCVGIFQFYCMSSEKLTCWHLLTLCILFTSENGSFPPVFKSMFFVKKKKGNTQISSSRDNY